MGIIRPCTYMSVEKWNVSVTEGDDVDVRASRKLSSGVCGLDYGHVVQKAGEGHHGQLWTGRCALPSIMGENTHVGLQVPYIFLERGGERQKSHGKHKALRKGIPQCHKHRITLYMAENMSQEDRNVRNTLSYISTTSPIHYQSMYTTLPNAFKTGQPASQATSSRSISHPSDAQQKPKPIYPNSTNAFASPPK